MKQALRRSAVADVMIAVGAAVAICVITANIPPAARERDVDLIAYVVMSVAGLALVGRRREPRIMLAVIVLALLVYMRRDYPGGPVFLTLAVALYALAIQARNRREMFIPAVITVAVMIAGGTIGLGDVEWTWHVAVFPGWAAAALFLGEASRNRRDYLVGLEERNRYLEDTREEEARRQVAEERLRIARDLHDVVAHTIATINLQSGVAAHVFERDPEQAAEALAAIRRASGTAMHELKVTLDVLRSAGDSTAPRLPTPGLDRVDDLVAPAAEAGLAVSVERLGQVKGLPSSVDVAGYRIVQESMTNVMRHSHASRAAITIRSSPEAVDIEVLDDGRGSSVAAGQGHGIAGMKERAALVGGTLEVGPNPGGGYRVRAHLPITGTDR